VRGLGNPSAVRLSCFVPVCSADVAPAVGSRWTGSYRFTGAISVTARRPDTVWPATATGGGRHDRPHRFCSLVEAGARVGCARYRGGRCGRVGGHYGFRRERTIAAAPLAHASKHFWPELRGGADRSRRVGA